MATKIDEDVKLVIDGQSYEGWQDVTISMQINSIARGFRLQMSYDKRGNFPNLTPDTPCEIYVNGSKRVTGRIDDIEGQKNAQGHSRVISGRSITRNLIDSSVHIKTNQLNNVTLEELCRRFCRDFDISVINEAGSLPNIKVVRWADGATYARVIQDEARKIGVTVRDDENGNLVLTKPRARPSRAQVAEGSGGKELKDSNVESWRVVRSAQQRFSHYVVKGRDSTQDGRAGNQKYGEAQDTGLKSFRPLIIKAEGDITNAIARERARFEVNRRIGLSYGVSMTVSGWRHAQDGEPWDIDEIVPVSIPTENISSDLLTYSVVHRKSRNGSVTDIEFVDPITMTPVASSGSNSKASFDPSGLIRDLGPAKTIFDVGVGVSDNDGIAG